ncbi:YBL085Wp-like protein, partial [Nadsonia fulvescens var. elongata DSM 6958]
KTADYAGWISKKGSGVGTWRSRYFTLHNTRLSYFVSLNDTKERGLIDITAHKVLPLNQNEDKLISIYAASTGSGKYCFKLVPPGPGSKKGVTFTAPRTHYFAVDSKVEMRAWMGALIKATIDRDESVPAISSCVTPTVSLPRAK